VDLLREEDKFSKRPIQQLALFKEAGVLISLSDNYVSLHELESYALQEKLEKTKGATLFAVTTNVVQDEETLMMTIISRLAVVVKRKILIWSWRDTELTDDVTEITLVAASKSLTWATGTKVIAGLDSGFVMVDIETLKIMDVTKPGNLDDAGSKFGAVSSTGMGYVGMGSWVPKPMATKLTQDEMLLAKDVNTLFIDTNGKALDRRQVPWPTAPEAVAYSYPFLLALQTPAKGTLEIRNPKTSSLLQSISLPNASFIHVPPPKISLAHFGKGFLVGSDRCIWRMNALKYDSQIEELTSQGLYDEAISVISMLEDTLLADKHERLREIKMLKAHALFVQRRYRDSLELYSDAGAPPKKVIALYPKSIAGDLSINDEPAEEADDLESKKSPPNSPRATPRKTAGMLGTLRLRADSKKQDSETASIRTADTTDTRQPDAALEGRDLLVATNELCAFLAQARVKLQKVIEPSGAFKGPLEPIVAGNPQPEYKQLIVLDSEEEEEGASIDWHQKIQEVATLVDTTLFRAYMLAKPGLAGSLFRLANHCDPKVVRDKLYDTGRYGDLIDFLHGKKLHQEALEMLQKFGEDEKNESISEVLRGPRRTIAYLQQLSPEHIDLILEFAEWPLKKEPELGMDIFIADTENAETLPRQKVLDFLIKMGSQLATKYLEHVITELDDKTPEFHQKLIDLYLERLKVGREAKPDYGGFENEKQKLKCKHKLEAFLRSSDQYSRLRVLNSLPSDGKLAQSRPIINTDCLDSDLFESRAIILSKMGQHKQALQIYVFQLHDTAKAEEYCNHVYVTSAAEDAESRSVYHILLALYLTPPAPHKTQLDPALDLLSAHGPRLPASSTLALVPPELSVATLESYFRGRMRREAAKRNEERIVAQLRAVQLARVEEKLMDEKQRSVVVTEERLCPVCHKKFSNNVPVRVEKDGRVTHYGCWRQKGTAPKRAW
jgi:hypothetical protein